MSSLLLIKYIFIFVLTFVIIKWIWGRRKFYEASLKLPGPFSLPIFGSVQLIYEILRYKDPILHLRRAKLKYSGSFRAWLGPDFYYVVMRPEDVESMYDKSIYAKPPKLGWKDAMGNGLVTMTSIGEGSPWKKHRKLLNPFTSTNMNKYYYDIINKHCVKMLDTMIDICDKDLIDFSMPIWRYSGDAITESLYGMEINFANGERDTLFKFVEIMNESVFERALSFCGVTSLYCISSLARTQKRVKTEIRKFCKEIYDAKVNERENDKMSIEYLRTPIKLLMAARHKNTIDENETIEEMMNIWCAASDTSGILLLFALLMLAMHTECQEKAFKEIKKFYKDNKDAYVNYNDLENFTYLEMCIKETLRLFAPGPITERYVTEDVLLKSKNVLLPAGTTLVTSSFIIHRDPDFWDKPEEYMPERFSSEETAKRHRFAYFPFAGGPRSCLGRGYAKMFLTSSLVYILRRYKFENDWKLKDLPLKFSVNLISKWGYKAKISKREWQ